tara:strand:- start:247 stop:477 length:231 start_codon:yes stop_codon:yes gene_type:complete
MTKKNDNWFYNASFNQQYGGWSIPDIYVDLSRKEIDVQNQMEYQTFLEQDVEHTKDENGNYPEALAVIKRIQKDYS